MPFYQKIENPFIYAQELMNIIFEIHDQGVVYNNIDVKNILSDGDNQVIIDFTKAKRQSDFDPNVIYRPGSMTLQ